MTFTGSVTTAGGSGGGDQYNDNSEGKTTPRKFNVDKDARAMQNGGTYPNYWSHKTRSGHNFIMDDSEGNETVTLQHRSGSAIQMRPDGGVLLTTHNGKYEVVLGEERVTISGAKDITVKGDASMRVYGNNNVTVHKDYNLTVLGNYNITAKNMNRSIRGTMDTEAKTVNKRVEGSITYNALGSQTYTSSADTSIASTKGKVQMAAAKDFGLHALGSSSNFVMSSKGKMYQTSSKDYNATFYTSDPSSSGSQQTTYSINVQNQKVSKKINGKKHEKVSLDVNNDYQGNHTTQIAENKSVKVGQTSSHTAGQNIVQSAQQSFQATAQSNMDLRAPSGTATFAGGTTNINALSGMLGIAGSVGVSLDSLGSMLNLNGGIAQIAQSLGLSSIFNLLSGDEAESPPQLQGKNAEQPQAEQDASGEIDSWL